MNPIANALLLCILKADPDTDCPNCPDKATCDKVQDLLAEGRIRC